jgi:predicted PurR-regulated permease PerM
MFIDLLLSNFEIFILLSILFIVVAFILLFLLQIQNFRSNKNSIIEYAENINNTSKEIKEYLIVIGNLLENQKKEILNISEKIVFIEREINRLGNIKGSEDILNVAINMARQGNSKEEIINKTGLREDEVEAIYTYYKK